MAQDSVGTVLVTGGASGLGRATVEAVVEAGGRALVLDRVAPEGIDVEFELVDLADGRAAEAAVVRLAEKAGGLDAVFTAAGIDRCGTLGEVSARDWELVVRVNLLGTTAVVRAALPYLLDAHGTVVTCASTLGISVCSDATAYCASKWGVVGFTRALMAETKGRLGVTLLIPGGMSTAFFDDRTEQYKPGPDAKLNDPRNVARAVLFALRQPPGSEIRELVVMGSEETSYP